MHRSIIRARSLRIDPRLVLDAERLAGGQSHRVRQLLCVYIGSPSLYVATGEQKWVSAFEAAERQLRQHIARARQQSFQPYP